MSFIAHLFKLTDLPVIMPSLWMLLAAGTNSTSLCGCLFLLQVSATSPAGIAISQIKERVIGYGYGSR